MDSIISMSKGMRGRFREKHSRYYTFIPYIVITISFWVFFPVFRLIFRSDHEEYAGEKTVHIHPEPRP